MMLPDISVSVSKSYCMPALSDAAPSISRTPVLVLPFTFNLIFANIRRSATVTAPAVIPLRNTAIISFIIFLHSL